MSRIPFLGPLFLCLWLCFQIVSPIQFPNIVRIVWFWFGFFGLVLFWCIFSYIPVFLFIAHFLQLAAGTWGCWHKWCQCGSTTALGFTAPGSFGWFLLSWVSMHPCQSLCLQKVQHDVGFKTRTQVQRCKKQKIKQIYLCYFIPGSANFSTCIVRNMSMSIDITPPTESLY